MPCSPRPTIHHLPANMICTKLVARVSPVEPTTCRACARRGPAHMHMEASHRYLHLSVSSSSTCAPLHAMCLAHPYSYPVFPAHTCLCPAEVPDLSPSFRFLFFPRLLPSFSSPRFLQGSLPRAPPAAHLWLWGQTTPPRHTTYLPYPPILFSASSLFCPYSRALPHHTFVWCSTSTCFPLAQI